MKRMILLCVMLFMVMSMEVIAQSSAPGRKPTFSDSTVDLVPRGLAADLATAMDIPANLVVKSSLGASDPKGAKVFDSGFNGFPVQGDSFAAISTGKAKDATRANSEPGLSTDLGGLSTDEDGIGYDLVQYKLTLKIPANATYWAVDFRFLSEEYPEYVGNSYNDTFLIETPDTDFVINDDDSVDAPNNVAFDPFGNLVSINTTGPVGMSEGNAFQTTYDGATGVLTAYAPVPAGETQIKLVFSVFDVSDPIYDTTVFLDNFRFVFGDTPPGNSVPPTFDVPPSPEAGSVYNVDTGSPLSIPLQATDPDSGDTVSFELLEDITGASITNNGGNPGTGTFNWTPSTGQEGVYVVPFVAVDNNGASSLPLQVVVVAGNISPVALNDSYDTPANSTLDVFDFNGVLENDSDVNEDPLTVNTTPVELPTSGSLTLNADGSFSYTPDENFYGVDVFTYEVSDGELTDTARVAIQVGDNLLENGGFEQQGFLKPEAAFWKSSSPTGEKRVCDKPAKDKYYAFTGSCAYLFTGNAGSDSSISQKVIGLFSGVSGDTLILSAWIKADDLSAGGKGKILLKQSDLSKVKILLDVDPGTYDYTLITGSTPLTGTADTLKVKFRMTGGSGKYTLDDVYVAIAPASTLALPGTSRQSR